MQTLSSKFFDAFRTSALIRERPQRQGCSSSKLIDWKKHCGCGACNTISQGQGAHHPRRSDGQWCWVLADRVRRAAGLNCRRRNRFWLRTLSAGSRTQPIAAMCQHLSVQQLRAACSAGDRAGQCSASGTASTSAAPNSQLPKPIAVQAQLQGRQWLCDSVSHLMALLMHSRT